MPELATILKEMQKNPDGALKTLRGIINILQGVPPSLWGLMPGIPANVKKLLAAQGPDAIGLLALIVGYLEAHPQLVPALIAAFAPEGT